MKSYKVLLAWLKSYTRRAKVIHMTNTDAAKWAQAVTAEQDETYSGSAALMLEDVWTSGHAAGVAVDYDADDHNGRQLTSVDGAVIEYDGTGHWRAVD